jgi:hypothetical protein
VIWGADLSTKRLSHLVIVDEQIIKACMMNPNDLAIVDNFQKYFSAERVLTHKSFCRAEGKMVFRSYLPCDIAGLQEIR